jgi:hypothetical protein
MARTITMALVVTGAAFALTTAAAAAGAVNATPVKTGCPASYHVLGVGDLTALGYQVPAFLDAVENGGNGNGYVCGLPLPLAACLAAQPGHTSCPVPVLYQFKEDDSPARR